MACELPARWSFAQSALYTADPQHRYSLDFAVFEPFLRNTIRRSSCDALSGRNGSEREKKRRRVGGTSPTPLRFGLGPAPGPIQTYAH